MRKNVAGEIASYGRSMRRLHAIDMTLNRKATGNGAGWKSRLVPLLTVCRSNSVVFASAAGR
jgi:hypothetical protein